MLSSLSNTRLPLAPDFLRRFVGAPGQQINADECDANDGDDSRYDDNNGDDVENNDDDEADNEIETTGDEGANIIDDGDT